MKFEINLSAEDLESLWVVYKLTRVDASIVDYVGYCRLSHFASLPDARKIAGFNLHKKYRIEIIALCGDKKGAAGMNASIVANMPSVPKFNKLEKSRSIQCIETGEIYPSIRAAALANGADTGALSRHINGSPSHNTIKGKTFRRYEAGV